MSRIRVPQISQLCSLQEPSSTNICLILGPLEIHLEKPDRCDLLLLALLLVFLLASLAPVFAYEASTLPLNADLLKHRFKQKLVTENLKPGTKISCNGAEIAMSDGQLNVSGRDLCGKPCSLISSAQTGVAAVWMADLDKNGRNMESVAELCQRCFFVEQH